jgi:hypothetical protein
VTKRVTPELIGGVLHKKCTKCLLVLPLNKFVVRKNTKLGFDSACKECVNTQKRKIYNPKRQSEIFYKSKYGLTKEYVDSFTHCQICTAEFSSKLKRNVDHCHKTGKIRGVLCRFCNVGLGKFYDSESRLQKAIKYLQENT